MSIWILSDAKHLKRFNIITQLNYFFFKSQRLLKKWKPSPPRKVETLITHNYFSLHFWLMDNSKYLVISSCRDKKQDWLFRERYCASSKCLICQLTGVLTVTVMYNVNVLFKCIHYGKLTLHGHFTPIVPSEPTAAKEKTKKGNLCLQLSNLMFSLYSPVVKNITDSNFSWKYTIDIFTRLSKIPYFKPCSNSRRCCFKRQIQSRYFKKG